MAVDQPADNCPRFAVEGDAGVYHNNMDVELRVQIAARGVFKSGGDQPERHSFVAAESFASGGGDFLQILNHSPNRRPLRVANGPLNLRQAVGGCPHFADALRCREGEVPTGAADFGSRIADQWRLAIRTESRQHATIGQLINRAGEPKRLGPAAQPNAPGLAGIEVIVVSPQRGVVGAVASDLDDGEHGITL